jgi:uncharacterized lipoprotein YddW (UPF0748 family)
MNLNHIIKFTFSIFIIIGCEEEKKLSSENKIISFDIISEAYNYTAYGEINDEELVITATIPSEMNIKNITPTIEISENAEVYPPSVVINDFSGGSIYTVTAENGIVANYFVSLTQKSSEFEILSFKLPELNIEAEIENNKIIFTTPYAADLTNVVVEFTTSPNAISNIQSKSRVNLDEVSELIITSEIGLENKYLFEINRLNASDENQLLSLTLPEYFIQAEIINNKISLDVLYGTDLSDVSFTFTHSDLSTTSLDDLDRINLRSLNTVSVFSESGIENTYTIEIDESDQEKGIRGVWLTNVASNVLNSRQNISNAMDLLAELNFNTVFLVTWNKTMTPHPSSVLQNAISSLNDSTINTRFDPSRDILQEVIEEAHSRNLKVIAWFEYGFASQYGNSNSGMNNILQANPHWASRDSSGNIASKNGFYWMNAFHPEVQEFMTNLILEVVENYDVDGIQGDDRLPAVTSTSGYDDYTVSRYKAEHNGNNPPNSSSNNQWLQWRADILSEYAQNLYSKVKQADPNCLVTFSPSPYSFSLTNYCQDWPKWLDNNIVEIISPQLYRYDTGGISNYRWLFNTNFSYANSNTNVFYPGVLLQSGGYVPNDNFLIEMIRHHRSKGVYGEVFFFFEGVDDKENVFKALYPGPAIYPTF